MGYAWPILGTGLGQDSWKTVDDGKNGLKQEERKSQAMWNCPFRLYKTLDFILSGGKPLEGCE
jgi:hypothetical protein